MREIFSRYTFWGLCKLSIDFAITKIFYPHFRLLRTPFYFRGVKYFNIGGGFTTGVGLRVECIASGRKKPALCIGRHCQVNDYVHIGCIDSVKIGDDVLIASKVFITDHNHGSFSDEHEIMLPPAKRALSSRAVIIGDKVWLGENVVVLPGVTIGVGSIIGASAVVSRDIPPYSVAVGNPAKVIKQYDFNLSTWVSVI